ncbi:MAG: hypothetical protein Q4A28_01010 [Brachymonas sp.]|nr:hypothetical protein [Brachymonas sp.]
MALRKKGSGCPHIWHKSLQALCLLPLACALAGCADNAAPPHPQPLLHQGVATDMRYNSLMDAAFGTENERIVPGEVYWQALLPLPQVLLQAASPAALATASAAADQAGKAAARPAGKSRPAKAWPAAASAAVENRPALIRPREAVRLSDEQVALVVESLPLAALSQPLQTGSGPAAAPAAASTSAAAGASVTGAAPAHIGVVFFRADAGAAADTAAAQGGPGNKNETAAEQWRAVRLVPHVDALMTSPAPPDVQVYRLSAGRYLVTYTQTLCQAGSCSRWLKGYLLQPEAMRAVFSARLASSNAQQWADCPARLGLTARTDDALAASVRQLHAQAGVDTGVAAGGAAAAAAASAATSNLASTNASMRMPTPGPAPVRPQPTGSGQPATTRPAVAAQQSAPAPKAPAHSCHAVLGEVHLLSRGRADAADVQIRYSGAVSDAPGQLRPIAQAQLFRLQGDQLVQIDGSASPVPAQP